MLLRFTYFESDRPDFQTNMYLFLHAPWYIDRKEVHRQFLGGYTHLYKNPSHNVRVYDLLQNQPYPKSLDSSFWYLFESFISITLYHIKWIIVFVVCPYMTNLSLIITICWKYIHVFWFAPKKDWLFCVLRRIGNIPAIERRGRKRKVHAFNGLGFKIL